MNYQKKIFTYCESHTSLPSAELAALERETNLHTLSPQMLPGPLQGQFLAMISRLKQPKTVLEIGTFTGYSAICLAQGLPEDGQLYTIEINPELGYISRKYFNLTGLEHKIRQYTGDAREIIPTLNTTFDLVFIDAAKLDYSLYYDLVFEKVNPGGLILADNVLWGGKVVTKTTDAETLAMIDFNHKIQVDERVENLMLPIRDGILMVMKR